MNVTKPCYDPKQTGRLLPGKKSDYSRMVGIAELNGASSHRGFFRHETQLSGLERFPFSIIFQLKGFWFQLSAAGSAL
jgi:hypothetical protein